MPGRACSYMPVIPAPPSNRRRLGDPFCPWSQARFYGTVRCHYGITQRRATLPAGGAGRFAMRNGAVASSDAAGRRGNRNKPGALAGLVRRVERGGAALLEIAEDEHAGT